MNAGPDDREAQARAEFDAVVANVASMPNAMALAAELNEGGMERSGLDTRSFYLARVAALAAAGAPPVAWRVNLEVMDEHVTVDEVEGVLAAIAPIIGTARYMSAVAAIVQD